MSVSIHSTITYHIYKYDLRIYSSKCDKQTVENQRFEITNFCQKQSLVIDDWIEETISGTKPIVNAN